MTPAQMVYAIVGAALVAVAIYVTHTADSISYARQGAEFAAYRAQASGDYADAQKAARDALQSEITKRTAAEARNDQIQASLESAQAAAAAAHSDADFARRLLAAAIQDARAATTSHPTNEAGGATQPDGATTASSDRPASTLFADVTDSAAECRDAIQRFAGLQLELAGQVDIQ